MIGSSGLSVMSPTSILKDRSGSGFGEMAAKTMETQKSVDIKNPNFKKMASSVLSSNEVLDSINSEEKS